MAKGKKTGGRKAGTPNFNLMPARELAEKMGIDPLQILLHFANNDWKALGYDDPYVVMAVDEGKAAMKERITSEIRSACAKEAAKYIRPTLKAVEHTGDLDMGLVVKVQDYSSDK
jgi:hypothetical protein